MSKNFLQIPNFYSSLKNPEKYCGKKKVVTIRSSLELKMVLKLDRLIEVIEWSSEDKIISYKDMRGQRHKYFVDFWIRYLNSDGVETCKLIEIKPYYQTIPPKDTYSTYSKFEWMKNNLKWKAAIEYCDNLTKNGVLTKFQIITEKDL